MKHVSQVSLQSVLFLICQPRANILFFTAFIVHVNQVILLNRTSQFELVMQLGKSRYGKKTHLLFRQRYQTCNCFNLEYLICLQSLEKFQMTWLRRIYKNYGTQNGKFSQFQILSNLLVLFYIRYLILQHLASHVMILNEHKLHFRCIQY